jgi:hypothetical protein
MNSRPNARWFMTDTGPNFLFIFPGRALRRGLNVTVAVEKALRP